MSIHKNVVNMNTRKTPEQIRQELEARVARLKARPVEPEIAKSVALREAVANHVFEIMQAQGITQAELARRLGKSRAHVCKVLGGANLTLDSLAALSEALGCRIDVRFEDKSSFMTNAQLSKWENLERPDLKLVQGDLLSPFPWRKIPEFDEQTRFIPDKTKSSNLTAAGQKVTDKKIDVAA